MTGNTDKENVSDAVKAVGEAHRQMQTVLNRCNDLEKKLREAIILLDGHAGYIPKMYPYKGSNTTVHEDYITKINELRKVVL